MDRYRNKHSVLFLVCFVETSHLTLPIILSLLVWAIQVFSWLSQFKSNDRGAGLDSLRPESKKCNVPSQKGHY